MYNDRGSSSTTLISNGEYVTGFKKKYVRFQWVVEDIYVFRSRIRDTALPFGEVSYVESPLIDPLVLPGKWTIRLFPYYKNDIKMTSSVEKKSNQSTNKSLFNRSKLLKGGLAIFIIGHSPVSVNAGFTLSVIDDEGNVKTTNSTGQKFHLFPSDAEGVVGFDDFVTSEDVLQSCINPDGSIRILLDMQVFIAAGASTTLLLPGQRMLHDIKRFVETQEGERKTSEEGILEDPTSPVMKDAVFISKSERFPCSKFLLCVRCEALREKIMKLSDERSVYEIVVNDFEPLIIKNFLEFLSTDMCDMVSDRVQKRDGGCIVKNTSDYDAKNNCIAGLSKVLNGNRLSKIVSNTIQSSISNLLATKQLHAQNQEAKVEDSTLVPVNTNTFKPCFMKYNHIQMSNLLRMCERFGFSHLFSATSKILIQQINFLTIEDITLIADECNACEIKFALDRVNNMSHSNGRIGGLSPTLMKNTDEKNADMPTAFVVSKSVDCDSLSVVLNGTDLAA